MTDVPIITIPIDSEAFNKFYEAFRQYDAELKDQPGTWKKLSEAMGKATPAAKKVSSSFSESSGSTDSVVKNLSASTKAMKDLLTATTRSNVAMSTLMESSTGVAKGLFDAGAGLLGIKKVLGSFGPLGTAISAGLAVAGGLGDLALKSAGSVSNVARGAFGANTSYGQFQNTQASLSPFLPNPGGSLQGVAAAQWNPAAAGMLGLYGVQGKPSPQAMTSILQQSVAALRRSHNLMLPQVSFAEQLLGLSPTDMISLANQSPKDLNAAYQNMLNPKLNAAQNVAGSVISSDQRTAASWAVSMNTASAKFATALAPLNPIVVSFGQSVAGFAGAVSKLVGGATAPGAMSGPGGIMSRLPIAFGGQGNGPGGVGLPFGPNSGPALPMVVRRLFDPLHNPGNIRSPHGGFMAYPTQKAGYRALASLLQRKYNNMTLKKMITTYEGGPSNPDHNNISAYIKNMHDWTGFDENDPLNLNDPKTLDAVIAGITRQEGFGKTDPRIIQRALGQPVSPHPFIPAPSPMSRGGLPSSVEALVKRLSKQPVIHVKATVSNPTSSRVAMSARAAAG